MVHPGMTLQLPALLVLLSVTRSFTIPDFLDSGSKMAQDFPDSGNKTSQEREENRTSRLEEDMVRYTRESGHQNKLLTIRQLKKLYPGDEFVPSPSTACENSPRVACYSLARLGACNGSLAALERNYQAGINASSFRETTGFHLKHPEEVASRQIREMQVWCRPACLTWLSSLPPDTSLSLELEYLGGRDSYRDTVTDVFGEKEEVCNIAAGMTGSSRSSLVTTTLASLGQAAVVPHFHHRGFEKVAVPRQMFARILTARKKALAASKWRLEKCSPGLQNCAIVLESRRARESHMVSRETYYYLDLDRGVQEQVFKELRQGAEAWIDHRVELVGTALYGIRKYTRGARLQAHLDHLKSHVISAILNIAQEVDSPWPLQILDHSGQPHEVLLQPGEMVWYESASLVHARSKALNGSSFENMFVHFMPRSSLWYRSDWDLQFGQPDHLIRLEDLERADYRMREKRAIEKELQQSFKRVDLTDSFLINQKVLP